MQRTLDSPPLSTSALTKLQQQIITEAQELRDAHGWSGFEPNHLTKCVGRHGLDTIVAECHALHLSQVLNYRLTDSSFVLAA